MIWSVVKMIAVKIDYLAIKMYDAQLTNIKFLETFFQKLDLKKTGFNHFLVSIKNKASIFILSNPFHFRVRHLNNSFQQNSSKAFYLACHK